MKNLSLVVCLVTTLTISMSFSATAAATTEQELLDIKIQAKYDAEQDADNAFYEWIWIGLGGTGVALTGFAGGGIGALAGVTILQSDDAVTTACLTIGCIGAGSVFFMGGAVYGIYKWFPVTLPPERLIGKSPEYVQAYTAAYKKRIGWLRASRATIGAGGLNTGIFSIFF